MGFGQGFCLVSGVSDGLLSVRDLIVGALSRPIVMACIPAFIEEKAIGGVVVRGLRFVDRVVVCDDGSGDLTGAIADGLGAVVVRHGWNMG